MTPRGKGWRTGLSGSFRFNRDFSRIGVGRISRSSHTTNKKEHDRRDQILSKLAESGQIEVLRAFQNGTISIEELVQADREQRLRSAELLDGLTLRRPLWGAIADTLPRMGRSDQTRKRYEVSLAALRRKAKLGAEPTVLDLGRVDWQSLGRHWGGSAADWNHVRRAVSAFLTVLLGDKYHSFRRTTVDRIPIAVEAARVPDVTPAVFWQILKFVPSHYAASYVAIAATGLRVGEFLRLTRFNLKAATHSVSVPGTKTAASAEDVVVHPKLWPYMEAAVPSPLRYKALRRHWKAATKAAGVDIRIHDLRHALGQWAVDAGVAEAKVQTALRHKTASMTRRYTKTKEKGEAAKAVGKALLKGHSRKELAQVAAQGGQRERA